MALIVNNRVKETTTTTGTGTLDLGGASTGFQSFVDGIGTGNTTYYTIVGGASWEVGFGTVTAGSPNTLSRTTILESSNADAAVNFAAGTKDVFCTLPAEKGLVIDSAGSVLSTGATVSFGDPILFGATFRNTGQPAFLATNSIADTNVTGASLTATIDVDTEIFDQASNFASDTFTAPLTGRYLIGGVVDLLQLEAAHTTGTVTIVTSNRNYRFFTGGVGAMRNAANGLGLSACVLADMDAADTATITVAVTGGTQAVDISTPTLMWGVLVA